MGEIMVSRVVDMAPGGMRAWQAPQVAVFGMVAELTAAGSHGPSLEYSSFGTCEDPDLQPGWLSRC